MSRLVDRDVQNLNITIYPVDVAGNPIAGLTHATVGLVIEYKNSASVDWVPITLVAGTAGSWTSSGFVEFDDGEYQIGLPNAAIVPGDRTEVRFQYTGAPKQYAAIDAVNVSVFRARGPIVVAAELPGVPSSESGNLFFTIVQRDDYNDDNERGPIGPITVETVVDLDNEAVVDRVRFGATRLNGSRLSTTHFIGTAFVEATANPNEYNVFIELTSEETDREPGYYRWDVEAVLVNESDVVTLTPGNNQLFLSPSMGDNEERDPLAPDPSA